MIQATPIPSYSTDDTESTPENLPSALPLLIYSAPVVQDIDSSKKRGERESFLLSRKLYNSVTGNKDIDSKIIVSYTDQYNRYNALKKNLKKTVFSVVGRFKIGSKKMLHIMASDIEWNYAESNPRSSDTLNKEKKKLRKELDDQLDDIEEQYLTANPANSRKKRRINSESTSKKPIQDTKPNLLEAIKQIQTIPEEEPATTEESEITKEPETIEKTETTT